MNFVTYLLLYQHFKSCKFKCNLSQVMIFQESEVDPHEIDEEKLLEAKKEFVIKIKIIKVVLN